MRIAVCCCLLLAACSTPPGGGAPDAGGGTGVPAALEPAPPKSTDAGAVAAAPVGASPGQSQLCPLTAPVLCGSVCCPWGDACGEGGTCQTTAGSSRCPASEVGCGPHCLPAGSTCTMDALSCPADNPVPCAGGKYDVNGRRLGGYCCPAALSCGPSFAACSRGSGAVPVGARACQDLANTWCPMPLLCVTLNGTTPVCFDNSANQPNPIGNCALTCGDGCCTHNGNAPQPTCDAQNKCSYPTRAGLPATCPGGSPQLCGSNACCAAADVCGQSCGCPPASPTACGAGCCPGSCAGPASCNVCPAERPVSCRGACCLPGAACVAGACGCPSGDESCGGACCPAGAFCDSQTRCARCPSTHPTRCADRCCGASQQCLRCPGEAAESCHDGPCPSTGGGGGGGGSSGCDACTSGQPCAACGSGATACGAKVCCPPGGTCSGGVCRTSSGSGVGPVTVQACGATPRYTAQCPQGGCCPACMTCNPDGTCNLPR